MTSPSPVFCFPVLSITDIFAFFLLSTTLYLTHLLLGLIHPYPIFFHFISNCFFKLSLNSMQALLLDFRVSGYFVFFLSLPLLCKAPRGISCVCSLRYSNISYSTCLSPHPGHILIFWEGQNLDILDSQSLSTLPHTLMFPGIRSSCLGRKTHLSHISVLDTHRAQDQSLYHSAHLSIV